MKTIIAAILAIVLAFSLAACEGEDLPDENTSNLDSDLPEISDISEPEETDEESASMTFKLGLGGETTELSAGDTLGDWTLESLEVDTDESTEPASVDYIDAEFSGTVTLEGHIERHGMLEHGYVFTVSQADRAKLPYIVLDDFGNSERYSFTLDIPEGLENYPDLDFNESLYCKITVSGCSRSFAYTEDSDGLDVVKIEPDTSVLYEEMLLNFGGSINYEGKLTVSKFVSLYNNREGYKDCSALDRESYYAWILSQTSTADRTEVNLPGFSSSVYAYEEGYYEAMVQKHFDVSSEYLRKSDFYYPDRHCYYIDAAGGGIGNPTYISLTSVEEKGDTVILHIVLSDVEYGEQNFALTVKLPSGGSYKYLSYLPE